VTIPVDDRLDKSPLEDRDLVDAHERLGHLGWDLDTVEQAEAELEATSPRELRAMIVEKLRQERFEMYTRNQEPDPRPHPPVDQARIEAYERWAGHLGLGRIKQ